MEDFPETILNIHIGIAITAVLAGTGAVLTRKSKFPHKTAGKIYVVSIIATALSAFVLMMYPDYRNSIMFLIGLFNLYFALSGYRSLKLKTVFTMDKVSMLDKTISMLMLFVSIAMLGHGIFSSMDGDMWGYVLVIYSVFGFINVFKDYKLFTTKQFGAFTWMEFHASKMIGSYIGAVTAVSVTQWHDQYGLITWFIPGTFGLMYMIYWIRKIRTNPESVFDWG